jgi:hypothetical protein
MHARKKDRFLRKNLLLHRDTSEKVDVDMFSSTLYPQSFGSFEAAST